MGPTLFHTAEGVWRSETTFAHVRQQQLSALLHLASRVLAVLRSDLWPACATGQRVLSPAFDSAVKASLPPPSLPTPAPSPPHTFQCQRPKCSSQGTWSVRACVPCVTGLQQHMCGCKGVAGRRCRPVVVGCRLCSAARCCGCVMERRMTAWCHACWLGTVGRPRHRQVPRTGRQAAAGLVCVLGGTPAPEAAQLERVHRKSSVAHIARRSPAIRTPVHRLELLAAQLHHLGLLAPQHARHVSTSSTASQHATCPPPAPLDWIGWVTGSLIARILSADVPL